MTSPFSPLPFDPDLPTAAFREEHVHVRAHLEHVYGWAGGLPALPEPRRRDVARQIVRAFREHVGEHARWEERVLYPIADRLAGLTGLESGGTPFTASMRLEHDVVGRWISELEHLANAPHVDAVAVSRRADHLLGLLAAHFEAEERVLLPLLDARATPEDLEALSASHATGV